MKDFEIETVIEELTSEVRRLTSAVLYLSLLTLLAWIITLIVAVVGYGEIRGHNKLMIEKGGELIEKVEALEDCVASPEQCYLIN